MGLAALVPIWIVGSILAGVHSTLFLALQRWPVFPGLFQMLVGRNAAIDNTPNNGDAAPRRRRLVVPYAAYLALATAAWMVWGRQS